MGSMDDATERLALADKPPVAPGAAIEPSPSMGGSVDTSFILGMGKVGDDVKILLDIDKMLTGEELLEHCQVSCSGATLKRPLLSTAATGGGRYTKTETALDVASAAETTDGTERMARPLATDTSF